MFDTPSFPNSLLLSTSPSVVSTNLFNLRYQTSLPFPQNIPPPLGINEIPAPLSVVQILPPLASAGCEHSLNLF